MRAGGRALLLGLALTLGAPTPGAACEARGDRGPLRERLGVVFAGGGAKAAYEAGLGLALRERGIVPAAIAGTSSGAINAVLLATGEVERLADLWRTIRRQDVIAYRAPAVLGGLLPGWLSYQLLAGARGLLDPAPLRATLARHVDLDRLRSARVPVLDVQVLTPSTPLRIRPLDFDGARLGPLVDLGRADGRRCIEALGRSS